MKKKTKTGSASNFSIPKFNTFKIIYLSINLTKVSIAVFIFRIHMTVWILRIYNVYTDTSNLAIASTFYRWFEYSCISMPRCTIERKKDNNDLLS